MKKQTANKKTPSINKRILILVEGLNTEKFYFESFKKNDKWKRNLAAVNVEIYKPKDHSPRGLLVEAKKRIKDSKKEKYPFESVWIIFDRDGHAHIPETFHETEEWNKTKEKIEIAYSSICFEYWILLHFERTSKPFQKCNDVIYYIKENHEINYDKSKNYDFICLHDKVNTAVDNAKWLEQQKQDEIEKEGLYEINPITTVYKLAEKMIQGFK